MGIIFGPLLQIFQKNRLYFVFSFTLIALGLVTLIFIKKGEEVVLLNSIHTQNLNTFFMFITKLGEWLGIIGVAVFIFLLRDKKIIGFYLLALLFTSILSQGLKHWVFADEHRPAYSFKMLNKIEGLERHTDNSFPSGHTTTAFTIFTVLAIAYPRYGVPIVSLVLASLVGVSRIYLGQHYLSDVVTGAIIGLLIPVIVYFYYTKFRPYSYENT